MDLPMRRPEPTSGPNARPPQRERRWLVIVVVEDNADTRSSLRDALESDGYEVFATGDGREALQHLRSAPVPNAIVLDLYMPGLSGFEIYSAVRGDRRLSQVPIIVVTAAAPSERTGLVVAATIRKPFEVHEFLHAVRSAVDQGTQSSGGHASASRQP